MEIEELAKEYANRRLDVSEELGCYLVKSVFLDGAEYQREKQDEFVIGFAEWKDDNFSMYGDKTYYAKTSSQYFDITKYAGKEKPTKYYITKELLEIYKKNY